MKVKIQQFLFGQNHSWSIVGQNIGKALLQLNHDVDFISTDGYNKKYILDSSIKNIKQVPDHKYDMQISYTAMHNFPNYLKYGSKNKFGIYCYEFAPYLPKSMIKYHTFCDKILAPSSFAKDIFLTTKVPEDKLVVVPHGVNEEQFENKNKFALKTKKTFKFLMVIGQPHGRKRIDGAIEAFYRAFTNKDDVCLVAKIAAKKQLDAVFEVDVNYIISELNKKYPNHPEIELITEYVPNIIELHNACQVIYTLTYAEAFYIPALDGHFAGNLVVAPRYGGHLDFCNDENSLLINGKLVKAPIEYQYYEGDPRNHMFAADLDEAANILIKAYKEYDSLMPKFNNSFNKIKANYTWGAVAKQIINLCN